MDTDAGVGEEPVPAMSATAVPTDTEPTDTSMPSASDDEPTDSTDEGTDSSEPNNDEDDTDEPSGAQVDASAEPVLVDDGPREEDDDGCSVSPSVSRNETPWLWVTALGALAFTRRSRKD
jgi:hypothetical protein